MAQWLVIGVGNEFRGDDALGIIVARKLKSVVPDDVRVIEHQGDGTALLRFFSESERVIIIDAVRSGQNPGIIHRLDLQTEKLPPEFSVFSSHQFGVLEAIELARQLGILPQYILFYGIEAIQFTMGSPMSPGVENAAGRILERIIAETVRNTPSERAY